MSGFLDRLPAPVRHACFALGAILALAGLDWVQANYTTWNLSAPLTGIIAAAIPMLIAYLTPVTQQYGVGSSDGGI